ncbi:hypothetical protein Syn7502_00099 [Synechococcus sp. PCC 7502]|uniref:hypothetical protein n=1 Tax=Synechococcus sp. PCC 7502 TaxID=1173263 RepID=UPI00029FC99C|nr:hypothetical protein [Synechococcus sp. PCC 7502]AFY72272.1 hypothetical protein Syn7502_00099 [Synechococcus sp. PCC 7502]
MSPQASIIKTVQGILAGDGNLYDPMNAEQGGIVLPDWIFEIMNYCKAYGITVNTIRQEAKRGKLAEMIEV